MALDAPWLCVCMGILKWVCVYLYAYLYLCVRATLHIRLSFMGINAKLQDPRFHLHRHLSSENPPAIFCSSHFPAFSAFPAFPRTFTLQMKSENSNYNKDKKYKDEPATVNCCF